VYSIDKMIANAKVRAQKTLAGEGRAKGYSKKCGNYVANISYCGSKVGLGSYRTKAAAREAHMSACRRVLEVD
jgi:hypothetical protein